jgi:WD40 repeat protein
LTFGQDRKTLRLWEAVTGKLLGEALIHEQAYFEPTFSPNSKAVLSRSRNVAFLLDAATGKRIGEPIRRNEPLYGIWQAAFSPDGGTLLIGSGNHEKGEGQIDLYDAATGKPRHIQLRHRAARFAAFSPDGRAILTGSNDGAFRLWDAATGKPIGESFELTEAVFSPDGKILFTGSYGGIHQLWDTLTARPLGLPLQKEGWNRKVPFSPDGHVLLTGSKDEVGRLVRMPAPLQGPPEWIKLLLQVQSGVELDENGAIHVLDAPAWRERYQRLQKRGGLFPCGQD